MRKVIAVIEWGIIIVMYVRWVDVRSFLRSNVQQPLAAKAKVARLVPLAIDRRVGRLFGRTGAAPDLGAISIPQRREFRNLEDAGILQQRHQADGVRPVANDNHRAVPLID